MHDSTEGIDDTRADDVMVEVEMLASLISGLGSAPDLFHALQFVTLAEAAILRDALVVVSIEDGSPEDAAERREDRALVEQFLAPLIESGAVRFEARTLDARLPMDLPADLPVDTPSGAQTDTPAGTDDSHTIAAEDNVVARVAVMAGRGLNAERAWRKPSLHLPMQQTFYEMSANVRGDHSVCDLSGRYASLANVLDELRRQARIEQSRYQIVPLPPLGLEVFRSASEVDRLPAAVATVRERYADLRRRLRDLQEMLDDPSVPLRKKLQLRSAWSRRWEGLGKSYEFTGAVTLANTNHAIYKLAPEVPGAMALSPGSWINLLKTALEQGPELWSRWRLRALHRTLRSYVRSPDRALGQSVEKVIKRPISDEEVGEVRDLQDLMDQLADTAVVVYADDDR